MTDYIYIAGAKAGPVKIGWTTSPRTRMGAIKVASPVDVSLLHCFSVDSVPVEFEKTIHLVLRSKRMSGEWFNVTPQEALSVLQKAADLTGVHTTDVMDTLGTVEPKDHETPKPVGKVGRPSSGKIMVTMRLDPDVVAKFKATGPGWQAKINQYLSDLVI